jgi:hypothetical protein
VFTLTLFEAGAAPTDRLAVASTSSTFPTSKNPRPATFNRLLLRASIIYSVETWALFVAVHALSGRVAIAPRGLSVQPVRSGQVWSKSAIPPKSWRLPARSFGGARAACLRRSPIPPAGYPSRTPRTSSCPMTLNQAEAYRTPKISAAGQSSSLAFKCAEWLVPRARKLKCRSNSLALRPNAH